MGGPTKFKLMNIWCAHVSINVAGYIGLFLWRGVGTVFELKRKSESYATVPYFGAKFLRILRWFFLRIWKITLDKNPNFLALFKSDALPWIEIYTHVKPIGCTKINSVTNPQICRFPWKEKRKRYLSHSPRSTTKPQTHQAIATRWNWWNGACIILKTADEIMPCESSDLCAGQTRLRR